MCFLFCNVVLGVLSRLVSQSSPCADLEGVIVGPTPPWKITRYIGFYRN